MKGEKKLLRRQVSAGAMATVISLFESPTDISSRACYHNVMGTQEWMESMKK